MTNKPDAAVDGWCAINSDGTVRDVALSRSSIEVRACGISPDDFHTYEDYRITLESEINAQLQAGLQIKLVTLVDPTELARLRKISEWAAIAREEAKCGFLPDCEAYDAITAKKEPTP